MIDILIDKKQDEKIIAVVENGKLIEFYEDNTNSKHKRNEGNIYTGIIKDIIPGMQAAFIDIGTEKNSFIHVRDVIPQIDEKIEIKEEPKIKDVIKINQKLLVQVQKDSNDKKGARTTTHIKLTGKYIVLLPQTTIVTISQKIENDAEKQRLIKIVKDNLPPNTGCIIRTSAEKQKEETIIKEIKIINQQWEEIYNNFKKGDNQPQLLYESPNIVEKIIIDLPNEKINSIITNNNQDYENIKNIINKRNVQNIKAILEEKEDIIKKYDLEYQIEKTKQRKVWLNCGGFITIDSTEALVAIDVNSGKYIGKSTLEDTIYKVNYEATIEIAKQLRLRDIGGIIIIDYIDMKTQENKDKIEKLLKEELKQDRAKTQVEGFTKLNLMELTRKHICAHNS